MRGKTGVWYSPRTDQWVGCVRGWKVVSAANHLNAVRGGISPRAYCLAIIMGVGSRGAVEAARRAWLRKYGE